MATYKVLPLGIWLLEKAGALLRCHARGHKAVIWMLTFLCYSGYCLARNPFGVVKSTLCPHCSNRSFNVSTGSNVTENIAGWAPFNGGNGETLMGVVDYSLLFSYAVGTFVSGAIADRVNHRYFLITGMLGSALSSILMGVAYFANIHHLAYFIVVQIVGGLMQSTGWPTLIAIMSAWFGKQRRGLIMGLWSTNVFVGGIMGTLIPAVWAVPNGPWGWSFITPALILLGITLTACLLLVPDPRLIGIQSALGAGLNTTASPTQGVMPRKTKTRAVGFLRALLIPGVVEFSLAFFFVKMVNYIFKAWLPFYIANSGTSDFSVCYTCMHINPYPTEVGGRFLGGQQAGWLSSLFDVGGMVGVVGVGWITDVMGRRTLVMTVMEYLTIPLLYIFHTYGVVSVVSLSILLLVCGCMIQACYITISTAVTSDLGTHPSLKSSEDARAIVTGIINGTGSLGQCGYTNYLCACIDVLVWVLLGTPPSLPWGLPFPYLGGGGTFLCLSGAAVGPLVAGWISENYGWDTTFYFLMGASLLAAICMSRLALKDMLSCAMAVQDRYARWHMRKFETEDASIPLTSTLQTEETSIPLTSTLQTEETSIPLTSTLQTEETSIPLTSTLQTEETSIPLTSILQTEETSIPLTSTLQTEEAHL